MKQSPNKVTKPIPYNTRKIVVRKTHTENIEKKTKSPNGNNHNDRHYQNYKKTADQHNNFISYLNTILKKIIQLSTAQQQYGAVHKICRHDPIEFHSFT